MFERLTEGARHVMHLAHVEALRRKDDFIGTEHILVGILQDGVNAAAQALKGAGIDLHRIEEEIRRLVAPNAPRESPTGHVPFSPRARHALELADEAAGPGHFIGPQHLLYGLLCEREGIAAHALINCGVSLEQMRDAVLEDSTDEFARAGVTEVEGQKNLTFIAATEPYRFLVDRPAAEGHLLALLQAGKSVALIGPKGVGKTSLVLTMARAKAGDLAYQSIDFRILDPLALEWNPPADRHRLVRLVPHGEMLTVCRSDTLRKLFERRDCERLVVEFREGGFETFTRSCADPAGELSPYRIDPPGADEAQALLQAGLARLREATGFAAGDELVLESAPLCREAMSELPPPWAVLRALWEAVKIERDRGVPEEVRKLDGEIKELEKAKDEAISIQEFERAAEMRHQWLESKRRRVAILAARPSEGVLSLQSVRAAIDRLRR